MTAADIIRIARARAGVSQAELARRVGRPQPNISRWERGGANPSLETLTRLVESCGLELSLSLFELDDSNDPYVAEMLDADPAGRLERQVGATSPGRSGLRFDPVAVLREIAAQGGDFMLLGRLACNLRGSPIVPDEREVVVYPGPDIGDDTGLARALTALDAKEQRPGPPTVSPFPESERWFVPDADATIVIVGRPPPGTAGFDDLAKAATFERVAQGLDVFVASRLDLIRVADASPWPQDKIEMPTLWRAAALERDPSAMREPALAPAVAALVDRHRDAA